MSYFHAAFERVCSLSNGFLGRGKRGPKRSKAKAHKRPAPRSLRFDPLEERRLLSVTPLDPQSIVVNQVFGDSQATTTAHSVATDDNGDFVVAWTRQDQVVDSAGNPITNPQTGNILTQSNVYARYFTDEVQRVQLPQNLPNNYDDDPLTVGHISLTYNAQTMEELDVTAGTYPTNDPNLPTNPADQLIHGSFNLWFDANNNGTVDPGETFSVVFDETNPSLSAKNIQDGLRQIVGTAGVSDPSQVVVTAVTPHQYTIDFGTGTEGLAQPQLQLVKDQTFDLTGFLPAVTITTTQQPFTISNIPVSQTDPNQTATAIQSYFQQRVASWAVDIAPFDFSNTVATQNNSAVIGPFQYPVANHVITTIKGPATGYDPQVTVRPVSNSDLTDFDVEFTGTSGVKIHAPLVVTAATDENGATTDPSSGVPFVSEADVKLLKQSSPEFQVNPVAPPNPFLLTPEVLNSDQAAVAMDPAGDFVITWRGQASTYTSPGSVTDIYARRFTPAGITSSYAPGTYVPGQIVTGVRALPTPSAVSVQQLVFDASAVPLTGNFELSLAGNTTPDIAFNSANLTQTAANIQQALLNLGYTGVTVTNVASTLATRFRFTVTFGGAQTGVDEPPIVYVQSAVPLAATVTVNNLSGDMYTFRVNTNIANPQLDPAVTMNVHGEFVITWANGGQDFSYFNGISMQRYKADGSVNGQETAVNVDTTEIDYGPDVALTDSDFTVFTWTETVDPAYLVNGTALSAVYSRAFDPSNAPVNNPATTTLASPNTATAIYVGGGGNATIGIDGQGNYTISWDVTGLGSTDDNGQQSEDVFARQFGLFAIDPLTNQVELDGSGKPRPVDAYDPNGLNALLPPPANIVNPGAGFVNGARLLRDLFRVSSSSVQPVPVQPYPANVLSPSFPNTTWPFTQIGSAVAVDIDGDLMFTYEGYAADVAPNVVIPPQFFQQYFKDPQTGQLINQDLLPYFNPFPHAGSAAGDTLSATSKSVILGQSELPITTSLNLSADVDLVIDQVLFGAETGNGIGNAPALNPQVPADAEKLGRLRAILENVAGLLRGSSFGDLLSRWDASPAGTLHATYTDSIVNSQRDGTNQRYYVEVPGQAEQGSVTFTIGVEDPLALTSVVKTFTVQLQATQRFGQYNTGQFETDLENDIDNAFGQNWLGYGSAVVRIVHGAESAEDEIDARVGTDWQVPVDPADFFPDPHAGDGSVHTTVWDHGATLYEITFQGEAHSTPVTLAETSNVQGYIQNPPNVNGNFPAPTLVGLGNIVESGVGDTQGDAGTPHYNTSIATTSSGSLVTAYTQQELLTDTGGAAENTITNDAGDDVYQNIYYRQLAESTDTAGPRIVGVTDNSGRILDSGTTKPLPGAQQQYIIITFNEAMMAGDPATNPDSVLNPKNYRLVDSSGTTLTADIVNVDYGMSAVADHAFQYGLNPIPSNKWEAILTLDGDPNTPGLQPMPYGGYTLTLVHGIQAGTTGSAVAQSGLRDLAGNSLNRTGYSPAGADVTLPFTAAATGASSAGPPSNTIDLAINTTITGSPDSPAVAANSTYHVAVWVRYGDRFEASVPNSAGFGDIIGQVLDANDNPIGGEFIVNTFTLGNDTALPVGTNIQPSVAMDSSNEFIVAWSGEGPNYNASSNTSDIFARLFDITSSGPVSRGNQFQVNQYFTGVQNEPSVGMAADGSFVVSWTSNGTSSSHQNGNINAAIYKRAFNSFGTAIDTTDVQVNAPSTFRRGESDVAEDRWGDYVISWVGDFSDPSTWGFYANYYDASGTVSGEFRLNNATDSRATFPSTGGLNPSQTGPRVSIEDGDSSTDPARGNFDATWATYTNNTSGFDIYARRYKRLGTAIDSSEFLVNTVSAAGVDQTTGWQLMPDIAVVPADAGAAKEGDFTVVWTSFGYDNAEIGNPTVTDYGIYARMFNADRSDYLGAGGKAPLVFRVNASTAGNQIAPRVTRDTSNGDSIIVWVGPGLTGNGQNAIFSRTVDPPPPVPNVKSIIRKAPVIPSISIGDISVPVGSTATQATFTVTLSSATTVPVAFGYNTVDGTATSLIYKYSSGVLVFAPGQTTKTIVVPVSAKTVAGLPNQSFKVRIFSPANATINRGTGIATLVDTLPTTTTSSTATITVSDITVQVGTTAAQAIFTVSLSAASTSTISMIYGTADGTAKSASGAYTPTWGTLTFSPGQTSKTISVPVAGLKSAGLANQTFILNLANPVNAKISRAPATATIVDAVPGTTVMPNISAGDVTVQAGSAATQAVFIVSLSAASTSTVSMIYGTDDGTAKAANGAYTPTWGTLTFSPGQTTKTIAVPVAGMTAKGLANQTFILNLANPVNGKIVRSPATATIVDAATSTAVVPSISVGDVTLQVGTAATSATFTVTLSAATTNTVTMIYGTDDGTAKAANGAYTPTWGSLTFSPGQTSKIISVPVAGMKVSGLANQTFILNLANSVNGKIVRSPATATIIDGLAKSAAAAKVVSSSPAVVAATPTATTAANTVIAPAATSVATPTVAVSTKPATISSAAVARLSLSSGAGSATSPSTDFGLTVLNPAAVGVVLARGLV